MFGFRKREVKELPSGKILFMNKGLAQWNPRNYDTLVKDGYERNAVVYACINKIKKCIASIELKVVRDMPDGKVEEIKNHPMLQLIYRPNLLQSKEEFLGDLVSYYLIGGNAYIQKNAAPVPTELFNIRPKFMRVIEGNTGYPEGYEVQGTGGTVRYPFDPATGKCEIMHLKDFGTRNNWFGLSPLESTAEAIDTFNSGQKWNYTMLQNGGSPSGIIKTKELLTDDQFERLKEMSEGVSGENKAGKKLVIDGDLEYIETGLSPKDMDFSKGQMFNARLIAMSLGVPPQVINLAGEDSTFSNYEQATLSFYEDTVIPLMKLILNALNRWLPLYYSKKGEENIYFTIDYASIAALDYKRREKQKAAIEAKTGGLITTNEARADIGRDDYDDAGDVILVNGGSVPLEFAESDEGITSQAEKDFIDQNSNNDQTGKTKTE